MAGLLVGILTIMICAVMLMADSVNEFHSYYRQQKKQQAQYWKTEKEKFYRFAFETQKQQTQSKKVFTTWYNRQQLAIQAFEDSMQRIWGQYTKPSPSQWVEYSADGFSVAQVDYKNKKISVEATGNRQETAQQMIMRLRKAIRRIITSKGFGTLVPIAGNDSTQALMNSPILYPMITDSGGKHFISERQIEEFAEEKAAHAESSNKIIHGEMRKVFRVEFAMATKSDYHMMKPYLPIVQKYAKRYKLDASLILATIHAESNFNPMARSNANAIGLMQLVPDRGALDAYKYLYGKERVPTVSALMDPETNIHLGCVYFFLLHRYHFNDIKDPLSVTYCSIAGYNTGPGNVAKAFSGTYQLHRAIMTINRIGDSQQIFNHLVVNLPYRETRIYLQKVVSFMPFYAQDQLAKWQK